VSSLYCLHSIFKMMLAEHPFGLIPLLREREIILSQKCTFCSSAAWICADSSAAEWRDGLKACCARACCAKQYQVRSILVVQQKDITCSREKQHEEEEIGMHIMFLKIQASTIICCCVTSAEAVQAWRAHAVTCSTLLTTF